MFFLCVFSISRSMTRMRRSFPATSAERSLPAKAISKLMRTSTQVYQRSVIEPSSCRTRSNTSQFQSLYNEHLTSYKSKADVTFLCFLYKNYGSARYLCMKNSDGYFGFFLCFKNKYVLRCWS